MVRVTTVVQRWRIKQELKNRRKIVPFFVFCSTLFSSLFSGFVLFLNSARETNVWPLIHFKALSLPLFPLEATHRVDTKHTQRPPQQENHTPGEEWLICKCIKDLTGRKLELWCTVIYPVALNRSQTQSGCVCCKWCRVGFSVCFCSMLVSLMWDLDHLLYGGGWVELHPWHHTVCLRGCRRLDSVVGQVCKWCFFYGSDSVITKQCVFLLKGWCNWTAREHNMLAEKLYKMTSHILNLNIFGGYWFVADHRVISTQIYIESCAVWSNDTE